MLTTNDAEYSTQSHLRKSRCHLNANETVSSAANLSLSVVHTESSLNLGGQELRILTQMQWLLEHQIDTWLFARETSAIYAEAKSRGFPLIAGNFRASCNPILTHRILRFVQKRRNCVIDCHGSRDASVVAPLQLLGWPVIRTQHICKTLKSGVYHSLIWNRGNSRVIACSESISKRLVAQRLAALDRISVVGEAADERIFNPSIDGTKIRQQWSINTGTKIVSVIGMIRPDKAQVKLVQAVDLLSSRIGDCVFLIVGSATRPEYENQLASEIARSSNRHKIIRTGFQKNVAEYIAASDVIVLTSLKEAQSRIIPEAFSMKRPVVAPEIGGIPEIATHDETALLYPSGNVQALADAIVQALTADTTRLTANAYRFAQDSFRLDSHMNLTLSIYLNVLRKFQ